MKLILWKGYHHPQLISLVKQAWEKEDHLLILCPPLLQDFSFLKALPQGDLLLEGSWTDQERLILANVVRAGKAFPFTPVLGVFTSGTMSSSPRLAIYSKANILASLQGIFSLFDISRIANVFCYPQAFHTFGLTLGYVASHIYGWKLYTPQGKYSRSSHEERLSLKDKNTLTLGTPTHFFDWLQIVRQAGLSVTPSYSCIMGGAGVSRELWLAVQNELHIEAPSIGYGCTEAAPGITHLAPGKIPSVDDEIGLPLPSLSSAVTPEGVVIEGASLCPALIQDGVVEFPHRLTIRDQIAFTHGGSWVYGGRLDLVLNRGGQKFSLEAIEKRLQAALTIEGLVATTVKDTRLGEDLGLAIIENATCSRERIVTNAQDLLMREFGLRVASKRIIFVKEFPLNECSKLDRRATRVRIEEVSS